MEVISISDYLKLKKDYEELSKEFYKTIEKYQKEKKEKEEYMLLLVEALREKRIRNVKD